MDDKVFSSEWMIKAILVTLYCCPPVGIVGFVYRNKARKLYHQGLQRAYCEACAKANKWINRTAVCGIVLWLGVIVVVLLNVA